MRGVIIWLNCIYVAVKYMNYDFFPNKFGVFCAGLLKKSMLNCYKLFNKLTMTISWVTFQTEDFLNHFHLNYTV